MTEKKNASAENQKYKKTGKLQKLILIAVIFAFICAGSMLAKYRSDNEKQAQMIAAEFHFTSDYLEEDGASYEITDWKDGFDIKLYNYEKENTALIAQEKITYEVTLSDAQKWLCEDSKGGAFAVSQECEEQTIKIKPQTGTSEGDSVTVTVKTTAPFVKTLSATFTMSGSVLPKYTITDPGNGTVVLTLTTNGYSGVVNLSWSPEKYTPDNTNSYMENWKDSNPNETITVEKNNTYQLVFFKNISEQVTDTNGTGNNITLS